MRRRDVTLASLVVACVGALQVSIASADPPEPPTLLFPAANAVLDNGCSDGCDRQENDFDWADVPGADRYEIELWHQGAEHPAIHAIVTDSSYSESEWAYVTNGNRQDWHWEVRAGNGDGWGEWSMPRPAEFEPLGSDCDYPTAVPHACSVQSSEYSGDAPFEVTFTARVSDPDGSIVAYRWDLDGDGVIDTTVISQPTLTHVFTEPGFYRVQLVAVDNRGATANSDGAVLVTGASPSDEHTLVVPAVIHAPGASGTNWRTDLSMINWSGTDTAVHVRFVSAEDGSVTDTSASFPAGSELSWSDVAVSLFGFDPAASVKGVVQIDADVATVAQARTYNLTATGSFGQHIPAVAIDDGISTGVVGVLQALRSDERFRTNIGVVHLDGPESCAVRVSLLDPSGEYAGNPVQLSVAANSYTQIDRFFAAAQATGVSRGFAVVEVDTPGCTVWAYGSVVDGQTGDATTSPLSRYPSR